MMDPDLPLHMISTDFDGTIHEEFSDPPMPVALVEVLALLQSKGVLWVINTGRDMASLMESLGRARVQIRPDYLVLIEREIYRNDKGHYVPLEPWNQTCHAEHASLFLEVADSIGQLRESLMQRFDAVFYEDAWSPLCAIARTNGQMDAIQGELDVFCEGHPRLTTVRNDIYVRLSHVAYSKGTALAELQRQLGISPEKTLAAGDHMNDEPMLRRHYARHLVAPDNAIRTIKEQVIAEGGWVMKERAGEAVLAALSRLGLVG